MAMYWEVERDARGCCLIPQEFNKQLPGMKRDASVYLYNENRAKGEEEEREREGETLGEVI